MLGYTFRLIVENKLLDEKGECDLGVKKDFLHNANKAKIIYNMLKHRREFPRIQGTRNDSFYNGPTLRMKEEFLNFTQYFPKFMFCLVMAYNNNMSIYFLEVRDREILCEKYLPCENISLFSGMTYYPKYTHSTLMMADEITYLLLEEDEV